jgi:hypothetical protein
MLVFALAVVFSSCAKPPEADKLAAKAAMDSAVSAGADKYAATDFESAKKLWDTSETQMTGKKYKEAKQGYIDAKAAFEKAASAVEAGKKAMTDDKLAAKAAMDSAVSAGADKYAATDFESAKKLWDTSETQMTEKKYKEAKQGYVDAKAAFEKAASAVEAGKKAMTDEANAAVASLEESWKNLEATAKKIEKKMKDKKTKDAWAADTKAFAEGLKATKDMVATDPAGAKTKAGELRSILDKWDATLKELAAAPAKSKTAKRAKKRKK